MGECTQSPEYGRRFMVVSVILGTAPHMGALSGPYRSPVRWGPSRVRTHEMAPTAEAVGAT